MTAYVVTHSNLNPYNKWTYTKINNNHPQIDWRHGRYQYAFEAIKESSN